MPLGRMYRFLKHVLYIMATLLYKSNFSVEINKERPKIKYF